MLTQGQTNKIKGQTDITDSTNVFLEPFIILSNIL